MNERPSLTRCLAIAGGAVVVAGVFVVGMVLGITLFVSEADKANPAPSTGDSPLAIVAIGDGYMSGEGAGAFFPGTDRPGQNECRRTSTSYPYLVARLMKPPDPYDGVALVSAACSGAGTANVIPFEDLPCTEDIFPDGCARPQFEYAADGRYAPAFQIDALTADRRSRPISTTCGLTCTKSTEKSTSGRPPSTHHRVIGPGSGKTHRLIPIHQTTSIARSEHTGPFREWRSD